VLKSEILNAPLLAALATCGHTDTVVIADCGLPLPHGPQVIDLALVQGVLSFEQVLDVLSRNLVIENSTLASEAENGPVQELCRTKGLPSSSPMKSSRHSCPRPRSSCAPERRPRTPT